MSLPPGQPSSSSTRISMGVDSLKTENAKPRRQVTINTAGAPEKTVSPTGSGDCGHAVFSAINEASQQRAEGMRNRPIPAQRARNHRSASLELNDSRSTEERQERRSRDLSNEERPNGRQSPERQLRNGSSFRGLDPYAIRPSTHKRQFERMLDLMEA